MRRGIGLPGIPKRLKLIGNSALQQPQLVLEHPGFHLQREFEDVERLGDEFAASTQGCFGAFIDRIGDGQERMGVRR